MIVEKLRTKKIASAVPIRNKKIIHSARLKEAQKLHAWGITVIPLLGFIIAIALLWLWQEPISAIEIYLTLGMWLVSGTGITVGFHRHFAHRSFQASTPVRVIFTILGSMAGQGPLIYWVALHRRHHEYSDRAGDPHSPHVGNEGKLGMWRGLWYAHIQWIFVHEIPNPIHYAPEILKDKIISKVNQLYYVWFFLGLAIPAILGGVFRGSWVGVVYGLLWGGLVRLFIGENVIWSINSITHYFGQRPFATHEYSTNNFWLAIPSLGESWHNNHHAFNNSAIFALEWWQVDWGGWVIRTLEKVGLVWNVKVPSQQMIAFKKMKNKSFGGDKMSEMNTGNQNAKLAVADIQAWLVSYISKTLQIPSEEVNVTVAFDRFGLDSATLVGMLGDLEEWLGYEIDPTLAYEYPTIELLAGQLENQLNSTERS